MIYSGSKYGSIESQVSGPGQLVETNHNLPSSMVTRFHERMEQINPELVRVANQTPLDRFASFNPDAQLLNDALGMGGHGEPSIYGRRPYLPEFEDITRQDYPVPRALANRYFRMFYKLDPVVANGIELYGDSTFSDFDLIGEGVKGEIKQMLDHMVDRVGLYNILTSMVRELLITGDAIPHCHFDETLGTWSFVAMHNPDQIEAIYTPFADMEPILHFIPDDKLIAILSSNHHATARLRASMPQELASKILMKQPIELSPVNCTLISRKLHPYEARGTSIMSRLWRIFALEDAIFNATIQTARRAAAPLRVAQIGDPQSGIAGTPQQEADLKRNLSIAERDPAAWLVLNSTVKFDTVGISDRVMSIDRHWDTIERIKLIALGISKGFLVGETTYASTQGSLTVWMQRLSSLRRMIEKAWLYPKFFLPVAIVNQWVKPKEIEVSGNKSAAIRVRRGHRELLEDGRYIIPHVKWQRQLDPLVDEDRINAINTLMQMGSRVSESAKFTAAGMDFEKDLKQQAQDIKLQEKILGTTPMPPQGEGGMGPGMGPPPTADPAAFEDFAPPTEPPGGMADDMMPPGGAPGSEGGEGFVGYKKAFKEYEVKDLEEIMLSGKNYSQEDSIWDELIDDEFSTAVIMDDRDGMWNMVQSHLYRKGYNENEIDSLKNTLVAKKLIPKSVNRLAKLEHRLDKEASSEDSSFLSGDTSRLKDNVSLSAGTIYEIEQTFGLNKE